MNDRNFEMRFESSYTEPDNTVNQLTVESLIDGEWTALDLDIRSPGFQLFIYGLFSCQHLYFRSNAAERGLILKSAEAHLTVETDINWNITSLNVNFHGLLESGTPGREDINYIIERMGLCPVSANMKEVVDSKRSVTFKTTS